MSSFSVTFTKFDDYYENVENKKDVCAAENNIVNDKSLVILQNNIFLRNFLCRFFKFIFAVSAVMFIAIALLGCQENKKIQVPEDIKFGSSRNEIVLLLMNNCHECKISNFDGLSIITNGFTPQYGEEKNVIYIRSNGESIIEWGAAYTFPEIDVYNKFYNEIVKRNNAEDWDSDNVTIDGKHRECINKKYGRKNHIKVICRGLVDGIYIVSYVSSSSD